MPRASQLHSRQAGYAFHIKVSFRVANGCTSLLGESPAIDNSYDSITKIVHVASASCGSIVGDHPDIPNLRARYQHPALQLPCSHHLFVHLWMNDFC